MFRSIVVPLDLEPDGDRALPVAVALAAQARIPVEFLSVSSPGMPEQVDAYELHQRVQATGAACTTTRPHDNDVADAIVSFLVDRPEALVVMATRALGVLGEYLLRGYGW